MKAAVSKILAMVLLSALTAAVLQIHRAEDISVLVSGQDKFKDSGDMVPDMVMLLDTAVKNREGILRISEADFNAWANAKVKGIQTGFLGRFLFFERLWFDFQSHPDGIGRLKLIFQRREFGLPVTQSLVLNIRRNGEEILISGDEVRMGRLALPENASGVMGPALQKLATSFAGEIRLVLQMNTIQFTDGEAVLDPRLRRAPEAEEGPAPVTLQLTPDEPN